ncbi:MAG: hypothetical protein ACMG6E_08685 [Candidatus Roizmanbacteria bacterium]
MTFQISSSIEPIEQNVHGTKGVYELVYFIKESKSLERFKKHALESDKCIQGKTPEEVERLVCLILLIILSIYIDILLNLL